mmetsp:Transcript_17634/g.28725  ORF Transcript_17634/g.28725 Transcript_17634/m.28725 type:complete len:119 (-) Transcript_17634:19-375(-)
MAFIDTMLDASDHARSARGVNRKKILNTWDVPSSFLNNKTTPEAVPAVPTMSALCITGKSDTQKADGCKNLLSMQSSSRTLKGEVMNRQKNWTRLAGWSVGVRAAVNVRTVRRLACHC